MEELFKKLDIVPKDLSLYKTAFSHSSYANEHHAKKDYERLEFLGDAVVDLVVADYLYRNYKETEGEMTKVRASYVCENALYEYSMDLGLNNYIKVGHGEEANGGKFKKAIVADIFEALMGAIYLDLGYATVRRVILTIIIPYIKNPNIVFFSDYKSALQEAVQTSKKSLYYELISEEGPAHDKKFTMQVRVDGIIYGVGKGNSKKEAEQLAAKNALEKLAL
ncbi:MAG TPA: ribonuclease III [Candidatus Onthousia faecavium]|nr:ribonuclease III [Candidatus Onthousia faecavium]